MTTLEILALVAVFLVGWAFGYYDVENRTARRLLEKRPPGPAERRASYDRRGGDF